MVLVWWRSSHPLSYSCKKPFHLAAITFSVSAPKIILALYFCLFVLDITSVLICMFACFSFAISYQNLHNKVQKVALGWEFYNKHISMTRNLCMYCFAFRLPLLMCNIPPIISTNTVKIQWPFCSWLPFQALAVELCRLACFLFQFDIWWLNQVFFAIRLRYFLCCTLVMALFVCSYYYPEIIGFARWSINGVWSVYISVHHKWCKVSVTDQMLLQVLCHLCHWFWKVAVLEKVLYIISIYLSYLL